MAGRPRNEELNDVIHQAALQLLAEVGYEAVSLAEVARRSDTTVATLYRRYADVHELIAGSLRAEFATLPLNVEDTGSLVGDLKACVQQIATDLNPRRAAVLTALLLPMRADPILGQFIRDELDKLGANQWQKIVQRAIERGELPASTIAHEILAFVIPSFIFQCVMVRDVDVPNSDVLDELVHFVLLPALKGQELTSQ